LTWRRSRQADWAGRWVPPPTVPTSIEGIVHEMYRSLPSSVLLDVPVHWKTAICESELCEANGIIIKRQVMRVCGELRTAPLW
jgi:hypothetical protein